MRVKSTEKIESVRRFVGEYCSRRGTPPSIREISRATGIPRQTVQRYLLTLSEAGELTYDRGITATPVTEKHRRDTLCVPLLGEIACGPLAEEEELVEAYLPLPRALVGEGEFFLLRARGSSMIEVGICHGDLVLVRRQPSCPTGQIAVVLSEGEVTLKRYFPEPEEGRIRLHPENREMADLFVRDAAVQGVAVKVIKDLV